jgi:predicted permease
MPVANWGTKALVTLASEESWRLTVGFGWNAFAITVTLAIAATCLFGLAPALAATRLDVQGALLAGRGSQAAARTRMGRVLIVAQVAISLVMLSAASLFARSLWNLRHQDFGFDAEAVAAADIPVEFTPAMMKRHRALSGPLYETAKALPGVRSAAVSAFGILGSTQHTVTIATPDRPMRKEDFVRMVHVSPGYFETLGTRLLAGRGIEAGDRENGPKVVVLSQTAAKIWFPGADPVGRYLSTDREYNAPKARLVVGVAQDVRFGSAREPFGAVVYVPLSQEPAPVTAVLLRTSGPLRGLRGPLAAVDPTVRVGEVKPLLERIDTGLATERTLAILSAGFGVLALGLTSVGVYGVIAYAVRRRTREIGVRIALGAARGQVTRLMLTGIARLLALGLAVGALGAYFAMRAMRGTLFGIPEWDLTMPVAAGLVLVLVAVLAAWLPARRAGRLDPMDALRVD